MPRLTAALALQINSMYFRHVATAGCFSGPDRAPHPRHALCHVRRGEQARLAVALPLPPVGVGVVRNSDEVTLAEPKLAGFLRRKVVLRCHLATRGCCRHWGGPWGGRLLLHDRGDRLLHMLHGSGLCGGSRARLRRLDRAASLGQRVQEEDLLRATRRGKASGQVSGAPN